MKFKGPNSNDKKNSKLQILNSKRFSSCNLVIRIFFGFCIWSFVLILSFVLGPLCFLYPASSAFAFEIIKNENYKLNLNAAYKNFFYVNDNKTSNTDFIDINLLRLMLEGNVTKYSSYEFHYENSNTINPQDDTFDYGTRSSNNLFDLEDYGVISKENYNMSHKIDLANAKFRLPYTDIIVGRQAITWGISRIWNTFDLISPFFPLAIDKEYKPGVDALNLTISPFQFTEISLFYVANEELENMKFAGKIMWSLGDLDSAMMFGRFFEDYVYGASLAGDIKGVGIRLEGAAHFAKDRSDFGRITVGSDYQFTPKFYGLIEYHFNGFGTRDSENYSTIIIDPRFLRGENYNLGKDYIGVIAEYQILGILTGSLTVTLNCDDPSSVISPALIYSISDNIELDGGALFGIGKKPDAAATMQSEYGAYPNTYYLEFKWYF